MKPKTNPESKLGFAVLLAFLACAGCSSTAANTDAGGAIDTGTYPNLNVPAPVAAQQFDATSLQAHNAALGSARAGQNQSAQEAAALSAASNAEQARLRRLARNQADTLKAIEARQ